MSESFERFLDGLPGEDIEVPFRRYRGYTLRELAQEDPGYLRWARDNTDWGSGYRREIDETLVDIARGKLTEVEAPALTDHQQDAVDTLMSGFESGRRILRLDGGAGYGKSFVTNALARAFIDRGYEVHATAVSYVATEVLRQQLDSIGVACGTLAKTLRFEKVWTEGVEEYRHSDITEQTAGEYLHKSRVLIVDEASMINDRDAKLLFDTVLSPGAEGVLILVGDRYQLPPVKQETHSLCYGFDDPAYVTIATLTVPMRYTADSHLYAIEQMTRERPHALFNSHAPADQISDQVTEVDDMDAMVEEYATNYREDPAGSHRMLLFRRKEVTDANARIREALFGADAADLEEHEQLMVLSTSDFPYKKRESDNSTRYYSGVTFTVASFETGSYELLVGNEEFAIPHYAVQFAKHDRPVRLMFAISDTQADSNKLGGKEYSAALRAAIACGRATDEYGNKTGSWDPLKRLKGDFVLMGYTYATSVHRAQGQTLDYAYASPRPLLGVRGIMGPALAYVACTRARKHLTILR